MKLVPTILSVALLTAGAMAQDVRFNFDKDSDFTKYKTYKWVQIKDAVPPDQLTDQQLRAAIDAELAKKGLTQVAGDNADLLIGYQVAVGQEKQFTSYSSDFGYGPGWVRGYGYGGMGSTMTTGQTETIHIGSVGLDMYDPAQKQLVWRGQVSKTLDPKAKPEKRQKNVVKSIAKLLKNYPPAKK